MKTVLITGAARGIGLATAAACARAGADVMGVDLHAEDLDAAEQAVRAHNRRFFRFACDIADPAQGRALIDTAAATEGGFDVLVNNAGVAPSGSFVEGDFTVWQRTLAVNLEGLMGLCHAALPHLLRREAGRVVNIASIAGMMGASGLAAYCASKHGVVGLSKALQFELEGTSVGVSYICPTMVRTRMTTGVGRSPLVPLIAPEQVAEAVVRAITEGRPVVYVPGRMRWLVSVLPNLWPAFWRWLVRRDVAVHSWRDARKELPA